MNTRDIMGEKSEPIVIVNKKVICNELLSNVLRGIMYCSQYITSDTAMVDSLEQVFSPDAVHEARRILYKNFYNLFPDDPNDPNGGHMGAKEKEIKKRWHIQDIIEKMHVIAKIDHDIEFCVPWDYKYIIVTDEEKRFREIIKEKDLEIDTKFAALEKVIEIQNRATIMAVESVMKDALENVKDVINEKKIEGISTPIFEQAEFFKGAAETDELKEGLSVPIYTRRIYDVQILNSLMLFCFLCFVVRIAQRFLMIFSLNI